MPLLFSLFLTVFTAFQTYATPSYNKANEHLTHLKTMKPVKHLRKKIIHTLKVYDMVCVQMTEKSSNNSLTIIFDHKTQSSKLKNLNHSLKALQLKAAWSFSPETWELAVTVST